MVLNMLWKNQSKLCFRFPDTLGCNQWRSQPDNLVMLCKYFCVHKPWKQSISKEMKKWIIMIWNLHSMTKLSGWLPIGCNIQRTNNILLLKSGYTRTVSHAGLFSGISGFWASHAIIKCWTRGQITLKIFVHFIENPKKSLEKSQNLTKSQNPKKSLKIA
jgi:hypothetical protein